MKDHSKIRVVVTGLGVISSIGIGWQDFWKNLLAGKSGITKVESFDTSQYERHYAGEVKNFDPLNFMSKRKAERIGRASQMAIAAAKLALKDAGLAKTDLKKLRAGVCMGMTMAEMGILEERNDSRFPGTLKKKERRPVFVFPANSACLNIALEFHVSGNNKAFATACASGNYSIGYAFDLIRSGKCDCFFAGGVDRFSRVVFTGFSRMFAIAPEKCRPFDKNRNGMIPAEGAGVLFLESLESAHKRKAKIYAEVLGFGLSSDGHHMTEPDYMGIAKAYQKAVVNSGINIKEVDYICAHGTGTKENDAAESKAIHQVFGERATEVPVSSIKSMLGHTMGAASALEAIACCLAITHNEIPPTINFEEKDPECDVDCVPNVSRKTKVNVVLNNASAFGGNNCCVGLRKI